uniref:chitin synthase n=1 Tax=Oryzias latipes TaxID=8090 RepID=A0A3P9LS70_ORYLA
MTEDMKYRGKKREGRHRDTWDPFQLNPIGAEKEKKNSCFVIAQYLVAAIVGLLVLTSAVIAKGSLLVLSTLSRPSYTKTDQQFYMLMLVFCLVWPNFLVFIKSLWKILFKSFVKPNLKTMGFICLIECMVSLGTSVLVLVVMPKFDILTNLFISGGVCIVSAIMQIIFKLQREKWKILFPICSLFFTVTGYCLLGVDFYVRQELYVNGEKPSPYMYVGIGIFASLLISICWWENTLQATNRMQKTLSELDGFRDFVFVISSILRILVIGAVYLLYHKAINPENIQWDMYNLGGQKWQILRTGLVLFFLQAFCSAACHWFGVVACKIHAVRMSFALPLCSTGPAVLGLGLILFMTEATKLDTGSSDSITGEFNLKTLLNNLFLKIIFPVSICMGNENATMIMLEITRSICQTTLNSHYLQWPFSMLALEGVCMWLGLVSCTYYVWKTKVQRIERTSQLFVRRLYESAFIDLSMLLNTKMKLPKSTMIYLCATMWHETYDEMLKILTSMFRLDRYRGDPKEEHKDAFDFECHIFVDDAFMTHKETQHRLVNEYVDDLIKVVIEVYRVFTNKEPDDVSIVETPYGGRLMFVMPDGNMLFVHLKDKSLIRNKKRWSQIMYMYYLLGWKGYIVKNPHKLPRMNNTRDSLVSMDGEMFLLPQFDNDHKRKFISEDNTYILALDGDTDFQPKAVILLVDRLRMYENVGAACGRIHPTGMGPMVWYQKFEYAVGHWLQKTSEHVFGSVLCSPGCFSLFRGSALMDDHVLKRYTQTSSNASDYVQYDQGEDRWLCTLLLQQGWRVEYNAASDAYTNSPQEFKEFYNQRRRWGPSTLANTLDLLHSGPETVKKNSSISRLYIFYQMFAVGSSILGPASVTLMIAGAFQFIFKMAGTLSIIVASIPPVIYIIICFTVKPNTQITIAGIMSVLYAFLMTASFFSIIGDMVIQETFLTPTGLFLVSMAIMYFVTALLHPQEFGMIIYGLMYFICIPSGYLLLTIYSLVNMNIVTWGTRESKEEGEVKKNHNMVCNKDCRLCCWDWKIQITQESENPVFQQIMSQAAHGAPLLKPTINEKALPAPSTEPQTRPQDDAKKEKEEEAKKDKWVKPVRQEFLKKLTFANMKRNLQEQIRYALRNNRNNDEVCEDLVLMLTDTLNVELGGLGPETVLTSVEIENVQFQLTKQARQVLKTNRSMKLERKVKRAIEKTLSAPQVQKLDEDFWIKLLDRYLAPIKESAEHKMMVTKELKSLRNKAVFLYFIVNLLWVVATFFLQAIGNDVISIKIPKYYTNGTETGEFLKVEPLSLMFLLSFAVLLLVQFLAMLYHRYANTPKTHCSLHSVLQIGTTLKVNQH